MKASKWLLKPSSVLLIYNFTKMIRESFSALLQVGLLLLFSSTVIFASGTENEKVYFLFQHRGVPGADGQWIVKTSDKKLIEKVRSQLQLLPEKRMLHMNGRVGFGNGDFNLGWSWHIEPNQWDIVEASIEECDGTPEMVEKSVDDWVNNKKNFCPWRSYALLEISPANHPKSTQTKSVPDCLKECANATPLCLPVISANPQRLVQLKHLYSEMFKPQPFTLTRERLAEIFEMQTDPMVGLRGHTLVENGTLSNAGNPSIINVESSGERLFLYIPSLLQGSLATSAGNLKLEFADPQWAAYLQFCDGVLNDTYGGTVLSLDADEEHLVLSTSNGCAELPLKPSENLSEITNRMVRIANFLSSPSTPAAVKTLMKFGDPKEKPCEELPQGYGHACNTCPVYEFQCHTQSGTTCIQVTGLGPGKKEEARYRAEVHTGGTCTDSKYFKSNAESCSK